MKLLGEQKFHQHRILILRVQMAEEYLGQFFVFSEALITAIVHTSAFEIILCQTVVFSRPRKHLKELIHLINGSFTPSGISHVRSGLLTYVDHLDLHFNEVDTAANIRLHRRLSP